MQNDFLGYIYIFMYIVYLKYETKYLNNCKQFKLKSKHLDINYAMVGTRRGGGRPKMLP